jgi:hypothetical protein
MLRFGKLESPIFLGLKLWTTQNKFMIEFYDNSELLKIAHNI